METNQRPRCITHSAHMDMPCVQGALFQMILFFPWSQALCSRHYSPQKGSPLFRVSLCLWRAAAKLLTLDRSAHCVRMFTKKGIREMSIEEVETNRLWCKLMLCMLNIAAACFVLWNLPWNVLKGFKMSAFGNEYEHIKLHDEAELLE